jgi:hypothetical protein
MDRPDLERRLNALASLAAPVRLATQHEPGSGCGAVAESLPST